MKLLAFSILVAGALLRSAWAFAETMEQQHRRQDPFRQRRIFDRYHLPTAASPPPPLFRQSGGTRLDATVMDAIGALRGGVSDDVLAAEAFEWCSNLGAPAALVAGAVLATLSSTRNELTPREADAAGVQFRKKTCRVRAFGLLFVGSVTSRACLFVPNEAIL